jgi:hypothetical protein
MRGRKRAVRGGGKSDFRFEISEDRRKRADHLGRGWRVRMLEEWEKCEWWMSRCGSGFC